MRARLTGASAALALAVLAAPAAAQDPLPTPTPTPTPSVTATPTPTPTPTPEEQKRAERDKRDRNSKSVKRIYRDFERDGYIDDCDHTVKALKKARRSISDTYKEEFPDFRDALTAAIQRHNDGNCEELEQQLQDRNSDPTPTATATPAPGGTGTTPAPPTTPPPSTSPDTGSLPDFGDGGSGDSGQVDPLPSPSPAPPGEGAIPEGTPAPTPSAAATPTPTPQLIVTRAAASPNMFVPGVLLAIALLGLLIAGLTALLAKRSDRFAGVGHAWQEAAWRTSGAWSDFSDWLRSRR